MKVLVKFVTRSLGDTIGGMPAVEEYRIREGFEVHVDCGWSNILKKSYPNLTFIDKNCVDSYDVVVPVNYHFDMPLQHSFAYDLGFKNWFYHRPVVDFVPRKRPIKGKYVSFGIHSTSQAKYWNYPNGWDILCRMLRKKNITPVCIDKDEIFGMSRQWDKMARVSIEKTGNIVPKSSVKRLDNTIEEAMNYIYHSEFFMGISSGLAWVAHAMGKRVVMISGVTEPWNEFKEDCIRINDSTVCHGCFHDIEKYKFDPNNWMWCPVHEKTHREFECTKSITPEHVIERIKQASWI